MGTWGSLPWDNDYAFDFVAPLFAEVVGRVSSVLARPVSATDTEEVLATSVVACDLFVRLASYWDADTFEANLELANARMLELIRLRTAQEMDVSYLVKLMAAIDLMRERDPLTLPGVPLPV